jgi:hypothetical protein
MGAQCRHVLSGSSQPISLKRSHEDDICDKCKRWYGDTVRATNKAVWVREVLEAIEAVRGIDQASLWHLFELKRDNGGKGKRSDRGECLHRLSTKMLVKLRDWIEANEDEAVEREYRRSLSRDLLRTVSLSAWLKSLPPDKSFSSGQRDPSLPLEAIAYTRSGRAIDMTTIITLERLRRKPRFRSERDLEEELGIPRSTIRHIIKRTEEIGFSLDRFTSEELEYVAVGKKRGRPTTQM